MTRRFTIQLEERQWNSLETKTSHATIIKGILNIFLVASRVHVLVLPLDCPSPAASVAVQYFLSI